MNQRSSRILSILFLLVFMLSSQYLITEKQNLSNLQEENINFDISDPSSGVNTRKKNVDDLTADSLVLESYDISEFGDTFYGFDFYNNSLYLIANYNFTARKVVIIELDNFTLQETLYIDITRDDIQVTESLTYLARNAEIADFAWSTVGDIIEVSTSSRTVLSQYMCPGVNPLVFGNIIVYLDKEYSWRFRNGRWFLRVIEKGALHYEYFAETIVSGSSSDYQDMVLDDYRFAVLSSTLIIFYSAFDLSFQDSIIVPGVVDETYDFTGMGFDGRYYWLLAQNTNELLKVDILDSMDVDSDGLSDSLELDIGTDLESIDTDNDGMDDYFEYIYGLQPLNSTDNSTDFDNDGITNLEEFNLNSDPTSTDTDNDGWSDSKELEFGTELTNSDTDGDGLIDSEDPRPLTYIRWWEQIGSGWSIVILVVAIVIFTGFSIHKKNS